MISTLAMGARICVGENKPRSHKRKPLALKYNGISTPEILKLGRKPLRLLTHKEQLALELYWDARLAAMGEEVGRGFPKWLTYEADISVLDFFAEDKTYTVPTIGERMDIEE